MLLRFELNTDPTNCRCWIVILNKTGTAEVKMLNLCVFIFIVNAVGGSARVILCGRKSKKSRLVYAYEAKRRREARRRRSSYEKRTAAKHRRLYAPKSYENTITYKNQRRAKEPLRCCFVWDITKFLLQRSKESLRWRLRLSAEQKNKRLFFLMYRFEICRCRVTDFCVF